MAPGELPTTLFTPCELGTSLGGVADLPVNAACRKYLLKSASFMPQTIFRKAVRSAGPATTITGATALPVSHLLRSDIKSFLSSPMLKSSTGFAPLTMTTIGSPVAASTGSVANSMAPPNTRIPSIKSRIVWIVFMASPLEGEGKLSTAAIDAFCVGCPFPVILQLEGGVVIEVVTHSDGWSIDASYFLNLSRIAIDGIVLGSIYVRVSEVGPISPEPSRKLCIKGGGVIDRSNRPGMSHHHRFVEPLVLRAVIDRVEDRDGFRNPQIVHVAEIVVAYAESDGQSRNPFRFR